MCVLLSVSLKKMQKKFQGHNKLITSKEGEEKIQTCIKFVKPDLNDKLFADDIPMVLMIHPCRPFQQQSWSMNLFGLSVSHSVTGYLKPVYLKQTSVV